MEPDFDAPVAAPEPKHALDGMGAVLLCDWEVFGAFLLRVAIEAAL